MGKYVTFIDQTKCTFNEGKRHDADGNLIDYIVGSNTWSTITIHVGSSNYSSKLNNQLTSFGLDANHKLITNNLQMIDTVVTGYEYIEITVRNLEAANTSNKIFVGDFDFTEYLSDLTSFYVGETRIYSDNESLMKIRNDINNLPYKNAEQQYSMVNYLTDNGDGTKTCDANTIIDPGYYLSDSSSTIVWANFPEGFNGIILKGFKVEYYLVNNKNLLFIRQECFTFNTNAICKKIYRTSASISCTNGIINDISSIYWYPWVYENVSQNSEDFSGSSIPSNEIIHQIDMSQYQVKDGNVIYHDLDSMIAVNGYGILDLGDNYKFYDGVLPSNIGYIPSYVINIAFATKGNYLWTKQTIGSIIRSQPEYFRVYNQTYQAWSDWRMVGDGGSSGVTYENTFNVTKELFTNTYNITSNNNITTDTNNFLASTNDQTDRAAAIQTMLDSTGYCKLGPGIFYISGVDLNNYNRIEGSGPSTEVHLLKTAGAKNYCFKMGNYCSISNMNLYGANSSYTIQETIEDEHGILFSANADGEESGPSFRAYCTVQDCQFWKFAGGGITCHNTGYGTYCSLYVVNCLMESCCVGINIDYWSEYHKFTNCCAHGCWYGCINNGGNNIINSCNFSSNKVGILMDNSSGKMINNSHGTISNCAINHTNSNTGDGIKAIGMSNGEMITGCQFFYSNIELVNCSGFVFNSNLFGGSTVNPITLDGGGYNSFIGNAFNKAPSAINIRNNAKYKFINNINAANGTEVTP